MASSTFERNKVFISYSHKDKRYLDSFLPYLKYLEKNMLVDFWVDTKIRPGEKWQNEVENALNSAIVAILFISIDFLNSPFIEKNELPPLLFAAESEGVKILPVILRPCTLPDNLLRLKAMNNPAKPLSKMKGYEREELWVELTKDALNYIKSRMSIKKQASQEDLSDIETAAYFEDDLKEAIQEMQLLTFDPSSVFSKKSKIGEEGNNG